MKNSHFYKTIAKAFGIAVTGVMVLSSPMGKIYAEELIVYEETGEQVISEPGFTPSERTSSITEIYNSDYGLYEESLADMFFFYSNVSNGSFTDGPVILDFPANIIYEFQKDGQSYMYINRTEVTGLGNYLVRVKGNYEGVDYVGSFRFSIREKLNSDEPEETDVSDEDLDNLTEEDLDNLTDEEIDEEELLERANEQLGELDEESEASNYYSTEIGHTGFAESYDFSTEKYIYTMHSGGTVRTNMINGGITNGSVSFDVSDGVSFTIYKDGEETDYTETHISDEGFYKIVFSEEKVDFASYYEEKGDYPFLHFRIVTSAVNDMNIYNAPKNSVITAIYFNGEVLEKDSEETPVAYSSYKMNADGKYSFHIHNFETDLDEKIVITKDTKAPNYGITIKNGTATIKYGSDDIKTFSLWKNGEPVASFNPNTIKGKGNYQLYVTDYAGNCTSATFSLKSTVNSGSVIAIVLVVIIVAAGLWLVRNTKTKINVR